MTTYRELLELAAKASGMPMCSEWNASVGGILIGTGKGDLNPWNPLTDDGDALRLAVKLGLMVDSEIRNAESTVIATGVWKREKHDNDPCAATRRAIVRAAAEIGVKS